MPMNNPTTIDITPTWIGILPALIALIENGNREGRDIAVEELQKLAAYADDCNARSKQTTTPLSTTETA